MNKSIQTENGLQSCAGIFIWNWSVNRIQHAQVRAESTSVTNFVSCLDLRSSTRSYWYVLAAPFTPKNDGISLSHAQKCQTKFVDRPLISSKCRAKRLGLRCFVLQHTWKALRQLLCQVAVGTKSKIPRLGLQEQNQAANMNT